MKFLPEHEDAQVWQRNEVSRAFHKKLKTALAAEQMALLGACEESSDPKVRAAHARFLLHKQLLEELEPK